MSNSEPIISSIDSQQPLHLSGVTQDPEIMRVQAADSKESLSSLSDLQTKAPDLYKQLCMSISMRIRAEQENSMRRFKEEQRKMRQ